MTELKDVIHLYLGCDAYCYWKNTVDGKMEFEHKCEIVGIQTDADTEHNPVKVRVYKGSDKFPTFYAYAFEEIKPILRNLSDMTEEEDDNIKWTEIHDGSIFYSIESVRWLLSKHFDLFGLIESGQAIDIKTIKK